MSGSVGTGGQTQNQNTTSQTSPWGPSQGFLQNLLGQLGNVNPQLNGFEQSALGQLNSLGSQGNPYAGQIGNAATSLLNGGGAMDQAGLVNNAYQQYQQQLNPYLQSSFLDPTKTPGFGDALSTMNSDITNQIQGQFAAAGRDMSGMNTQTLARGLSQGEGGLIQNQYNQNVAAQRGAQDALYGAGNTTGGILSGMQNQFNANQAAGVGLADQANQAQAYGPMLQLFAQSQARGIPMQTLMQQLGITASIGQMFGTQTGSGSGQSQNVSPLWQQILGGLIGGGGILGGMGAFGKNGWLNFGK
jgi:hypothetical protein